MLSLFRRIVPDFDEVEKKIFITHADVDHCGLLYLFDKVYASAKSAECLKLGFEGKDGYREANPLHKPYVRICKALTSYRPLEPGKIEVLGDGRERSHALEKTGSLDIGDISFELYEGRGGHLKGESILLDPVHKIVFCGDIYVNLKDMTERQAEYNKYAPILMTSVDTDKALCTEERMELLRLLGPGKWMIFGGHGGKKEYIV